MLQSEHRQAKNKQTNKQNRQSSEREREIESSEKMELCVQSCAVHVKWFNDDEWSAIAQKLCSVSQIISNYFSIDLFTPHART